MAEVKSQSDMLDINMLYSDRFYHNLLHVTWRAVAAAHKACAGTKESHITGQVVNRSNAAIASVRAKN